MAETRAQLREAADSSWTPYDRDASGFDARYGSVSFAEVHRELIPWLPRTRGAALDVGAGNGRDAVALHELGFEVVAVEPATSLRELARQRDGSDAVTWLDDCLPLLPLVRARRQLFDLVLCSAVLIHVEPTQLVPAIATLGSLLAADGRLAATFRARASGEDPLLFHTHHRDAVLDAAGRAGLRLVACWQTGDALGRKRQWDGYVFGRAAEDGVARRSLSTADRSAHAA